MRAWSQSTRCSYLSQQRLGKLFEELSVVSDQIHLLNPGHEERQVTQWTCSGLLFAISLRYSTIQDSLGTYTTTLQSVTCVVVQQ